MRSTRKSGVPRSTNGQIPAKSPQLPSHYRSIYSVPQLVSLVLSDVFSKRSNTKQKRKKTDYDPMQGSAGQSKTNGAVVSIDSALACALAATMSRSLQRSIVWLSRPVDSVLAISRFDVFIIDSVREDLRLVARQRQRGSGHARHLLQDVPGTCTFR